MTAETIIQSLASGLLMGLLYGLIAVGLALIFGLMDVVNFAHGEFLMLAMYATFFLFAFFAIDPLLSAPLVAAALFVFGAVVYLLIVRFAVRAKANAGMVQIFSTFGLAIVMRGLAQYFFTPDYRSVTHSWLGGKTVSVAGIYLPVPQLVGALVAIAAFGALYLFINRTDFGRALEATREDAGAVALVGIDKNRVFALGWGLGAALGDMEGKLKYEDAWRNVPTERRNSETGARLMPADMTLCPSTFVLKPQDGPSHHCEVVWRKGGMIGYRPCWLI